MRFGSAAARRTESPPPRRFPCLESVIVYEKAYSGRGCDSGADAAPRIPKEKRKRKKENVT